MDKKKPEAPIVERGGTSEKVEPILNGVEAVTVSS
jgi:hypothetical protein